MSRSRITVGKNLGQLFEIESINNIANIVERYVPIPTGFRPLDNAISDGIRKGELVLLGGAQGLGKTIASLQIARNIASRPNHYAYYLCYEHPEVHLLHRLLCLESIDPVNGDLDNPLRLSDIYELIASDVGQDILQRNDRRALVDLFQQDPRTEKAMRRMSSYASRLIMLKATSRTTTLEHIREATRDIQQKTGGNVVVFIDYLQKVAMADKDPATEDDKVTMIVEGLKDIALELDVPVWAVVASDYEGLKSKRMHLYHMRGSTALDYECDIAIIMNNKYMIVSRNKLTYTSDIEARSFRNWIVFTLEKNRAGKAFQNIEFELFGAQFCFNPHGSYVREPLVDERRFLE